MFWCIYAYFQTTRIISLKKIFFNIWSGFDGFDAFAHTSRPPETFFQNINILPSRVFKTVFWCICAYFHTTRNFFKRDTLYRLEWVKRVLMHLRILPYHQKLVPFEVVKNVFLCICAYFQTTRNFFSKNNFLTIWRG